MADVLGGRAGLAVRGIPEALLEVFSELPLDSADPRFTGREAALGIAADALGRWRAGQAAMVVVSGPRGCGVTSLLRHFGTLMRSDEHLRYECLTRRLTDVDHTMAQVAHLFDLDAIPDTLDELVQAVNLVPPRVVAVDDGFWLASRVMGSFQALRTLGAVMVASQERHLWVLGCPAEAWRRICYLHQAERYFSHRIELGFFDAKEFAALVNNRLVAAGLAEPTAEHAEAEEETPPLGRHLAAIHRQTRGKLDLAFFHLLRTLSIDRESGELGFEPLVPINFAVLRELGRDELFTLAEIAAHGCLGGREHQALFRLSPEDSRMRLEYLCRRNLIEAVGSGAGGEANYRLVPMFSDAITSHLVNANYLY